MCILTHPSLRSVTFENPLAIPCVISSTDLPKKEAQANAPGWRIRFLSSSISILQWKFGEKIAKHAVALLQFRMFRRVRPHILRCVICLSQQELCLL